MTDLKLSTVTAPTSTRPRKAPEYQVVTDALVKAAQGEAVQFTLPSDEHQKLLKELRRNIPQNTVKSLLKGDEVTVWLVDKQRRGGIAPTDDEGTVAEAPAEVPSA